jgi:hypothetical protein
MSLFQDEMEARVGQFRGALASDFFLTGNHEGAPSWTSRPSARTSVATGKDTSFGLEGFVTKEAKSSQLRCQLCRECAELRYYSEGGALVLRGGPISRLLRHPCPDLSSPCPASWLSYVFISIDDVSAW